MNSSIQNRISLISFLLIYFCGVHGVNSLNCFECSSHDDNFCPEKMESEDESIVPYNSCTYIHEGAYCVKTIGVHGVLAEGIRCYRCDETRDPDLRCTDLLFSAPLLSCDDVFEARYCIKATGLYEGSLGTRRFCSSRDMGNYCEHIKRPGDQLEYRSCVYTCTGNGCNPASPLTPSKSIIIASILTIQIMFFISHFSNMRFI